MATIKFLLANWLKKRAKNKFQAAGFTLLELIIALTVAALVITPLISVAVTLLETDRKEQARTASEEEIQTAIEYISRDLQQAVYIYDAEDLPEIVDNNDGIPVDNAEGESLTPVLVFWKRDFVENGRPINNQANCELDDPEEEVCDDTFVYSLVGYYLIEGRNDQGKWSNALRIGRFKIKDGVRDPFGDADDYVEDREPDDGFAIFDLTSGSVENAMRTWEKDDEDFPNNSLPQSSVLIDYIDQTETIEDAEDCPADSDPNDAEGDPEWTKIPNEDGAFPGFYVCVFTSQNKARIFLRGNALARVRERQNPPPTYDEGTQGFFPRARIEVRGTGLLRSR